MDSVGVNVIETAALGRPFQLGMLYDCRKDELIPGFRLWSKDQLQQNISTHSQINTRFNVTASDSIQDKSKILNIDGGLKLSLLGDLIHVSGAAKYLKDTKTSFKQQRLTLHYHSTSRFEELTMNHLPSGNTSEDDDTATHVVTAVLYGADACFVFDREVTSDEDKKTVKGEVKVALEKLQGIVSVDANVDLSVNHNQKSAVQKFICTFYGDFQLPSNPTSFEDALKVFADLPKLLKANQELAVPLRVWLYPLDKLYSRPSKLHRDISMDLTMDIESVIESLNTTEMKCSDLLKDSPALTFSAFHDKILQMKHNCYKYKLRLVKTLGSLLPNIRGDVIKETALNDLLQEHDESPFRGHDLAEWLKEREKESNIIKSVLRQLKYAGAQVEVNLDSILMDLEVGYIVSYTFTSLDFNISHRTDVLLKQKAYLSSSTKGETNEKSTDSKQMSWLTTEIQQAMRSNLNIFKNLIDSKDREPAKFIVSSKEMENNPGSCILLYENGCNEAVCFTSPSKPACPITEEVKGDGVILKVPPSCPATVELRLLYKPKQDTDWTSEPVLKDQHTITLTDLREETEYEIKCAAVGKLNYTVDSDVIHLRVIEKKIIMATDSVIENLNFTENKCSKLLQDTRTNAFSACHKKIEDMRRYCQMYRQDFDKTMNSLILSVQACEEETCALTNLLQAHEESPFNTHDLKEWIREKEKELNTVGEFLQQLLDFGAEVNTSLDAVLSDIKVENVVCYMFSSLEQPDKLLSEQENYLKSQTTWKNPGTSPHAFTWLTGNIRGKMRKHLIMFKELMTSHGSQSTKFIVSSKEMENNPGSCILLYEHGCDEAICFTPPSQPACPIIEEVKGDTVVLKVPPSCPATVKLVLLYKPKQDTVWRSEPVLKDQHTVTLTDLREETEYEIKCAAVGKLNYTVDSDVIRVITKQSTRNQRVKGVNREERGEFEKEEEMKKKKIYVETDDSVQGEKKDIGIAEVRADQHLQQEDTEKMENLFHKLHLEAKCHNKLKVNDVLQLNSHSFKSSVSCSEEMIQTFIQKLLLMNYRARYIIVKENNEEDRTQQKNKSSEDESDIFHEIPLSNKGTSQSEQIHPMDVQMAVFHCADGFLKQLLVTKLSQCQYALPLLVPDPFTQQIEFPLWTFRQINKSWKIRNTNNETISQTQPIYKADTPMVFFFRFGSVSSSKSQLMNSLINEKHNTFFHRNCPGSSRTRVLMDGVVEIAWFCPSGSYDDKFTDCVAFCNLHGDAGDHDKKLKILTEMSSVNVVLLPQLDRNDKSAAIIQNMYRNRKPFICLFSEDDPAVIDTKKGTFKISFKDRNLSDVSEELRRAINDCLSESSTTFRLEDVSKHSDIRVDEEDDDDCRRGREAAQQMMSLLEKKDLTEIKESVLPHQGKLWHQWSQKNKELHRPKAYETEMDISRKKTEMKKIRKQQYESDISEFIKHFIKQMNSHAEYEKLFFIKWLGILLDKYISADLYSLHQKYNEKWSAVLKLKENHDESEQLTVEETELERISEDLQTAAFGLEHIMREIGQIYESCSSVKNNKKDLQFDFSSLPSLAAEMMISGFPLELMDGDAAHVSVVWISAVLDELIQKLGDQRVFVLSVLGLQSSGKSTMLNAMFGLQFAVSAGRCTRGAFMQLVKVSDEMKTQMNFDYILVVDTEGLRAQELSGRSTRHHDNELATFFVGLANLTLINIFGENPSEMQDILQIVVQAFMRMKKVKLNPSCVFVHQNVSDVTDEEKNMEGRNRLQETLDKITKLAAKEEDCDAKCFSDVIRFDVQNDVKYFAQLWEGNPPMAPPNPNYCEDIQELKETIISHASKLHGLMLIDLKDRIKDLWEALLNKRFVFSFRNSLEISAYRKLETEYSMWSWRLRSAMMETENKLHNKIENEAIHEVDEADLQRELKKTSEEVEKSMSEFFEKDTYADILIQWKTSFEIKINELQETIVRETKIKLNEILQQRDLKKIIDAQRTHHENTLYEKSKELALKLKDKTTDEETLKNVFDLFWEQSVDMIIRDTPVITDTDIMRDVKEILHDMYENAPVGERKMKMKGIFRVNSYADYVQLKKTSGSTGSFTNVYRSAKDMFGYSLSKEEETQIRSLVTDVAQQTDKMIQSFKISKMGYNISYIQQLTGYVKRRVTEHQEGSVNYEFEKTFFMDLVYSICKKAKKMITDQHRLFRKAKFVKKKREEYYSIFQKYCHGAASAAIFGEIICHKLKEPIEQSVYKKTARDLTDEIRSNCESLNGKRSNLEKRILKTLAEEEDFDKYMNYIDSPKDHFKSFIRDEVSQYITDKFFVNVLPKMKENIKLLQQKIMKAAHESTEHVQVNRGDVDLWLKSFTQKLSDVLIFSEEDLSGVKHDDVDDINLLEDVIRQELPAVMSDISSRFDNRTLLVNLDHKFRPYELLIDHFCQCCWAQCPFCGATCTNNIENHDGDHSVPFHRVRGINGTHYRSTKNLCADICTNLVASDQYFYTPDVRFPYRNYRRAGGVYADWSITSDLSELPYWKWFVCRFKKDLKKYYSKRFKASGKIPDEWRKYLKKEAIKSLDQYI
ncbi:interferon-induced very large GTPase 1-like isoform X1 [Chanodichthys erythropterus]|uniref:interferon-induced very large GTPase 1-like isoform X1 n=1 Tax=Chanodichthys erythropterus TaxID=933992 RepID=UPI00351E284E